MAIKSGEQRRFGSFLIDGAATDDDFAHAGLVYQARFKRRRGPFRRVGLLDVVHEIQSDGRGRAGVERGENSRLAVGGNFADLLEAGVAKESHGHFAAFVHAAIFGGDAGLADPFLKSVDRFLVTLFDFFANGVEIVGGEDGARQSWATKARPRLRGWTLRPLE